MSEAAHPVFSDAPLSDTITLSTGPAPVPYHVYDGHGLVVFGTCAASAVEAVFAAQDVHPVLTETGLAIVVTFICDFAKASHGAHLELHMTVLSAPTSGETLRDDPAAWLSALAIRQDWGLLSLHLWNDTPRVVAYNTEYLGLQASLCTGKVSIEKNCVEFTFAGEDGAALVSGKIRRNARSDGGLLWRVMRGLGWRGLWAAMRKRPTSAYLINRKSAVLGRNGRAQTLTAPDQMIVTAFDPALDRFEMSGVLGPYGFVPRVAQHIWPFRFVFRHPDDV